MFNVRFSFFLPWALKQDLRVSYFFRKLNSGCWHARGRGGRAGSLSIHPRKCTYLDISTRRSSKKITWTPNTTVSNSFDFLPRRVITRLRWVITPLFFFVREATKTAVEDCQQAIDWEGQASTNQPWQPPTSHDHHGSFPQTPKHGNINISHYVVKLAMSL